MNYIGDFLSNNNLRISQQFKICGKKGLFYFDKRLNLRSANDDIRHSSMLLKILKNEYHIYKERII